MKLLNGERADIGTKLEDYILNTTHPLGKHKAGSFDSVLGINLDNKQILADALLKAARNSDEVATRARNALGRAYTMELKVKAPKGSAIVVSGWIVRENEDFPRLATCHISWGDGK